MTIFQELKRRGLIAQMSHEKEIEELLESESVKFYIGFDATAESLHIGSMLQLITMRRLQQAGHYPIALLGTATSLIGDPSGKTDMRKMLSPEQIENNAARFKTQMSRLIDFGDGKAEFVKNGDWFSEIKYLDFLRDVGRFFSVNKMLSAKCFETRLEKGLSFLELNYMLLQSYDFLHLYRTRGVKLELGGDDQWSNILAGADLVRRVEGSNDAFAMTSPLITTKEGKKMGKTEKGAIWIEADKCPVYDFFQYFRNVEDESVMFLFKTLTFVPIEEIEEMEKTLSGADLNKAKERLAFEITSLVHGEDEAVKARDAAKSVFGGAGVSNDMPTVKLNAGDFGEGGKIGILDLLVKTGLCASKREARTTVEQGGASVNREKVADVNALIEIREEVVVQKGKKSFVKAMRG